MFGVDDIILGGLGALGGIFGNRQSTQKQTTNQTTNSSGTNLVTPQMDTEQNDLRRALIAQYKGSLFQDPDLTGYQAQGQDSINRAGEARTQAIKNSLTSRGLSYSPVAAVAPAMSESQRISDNAQFNNTIPLLKRQLVDQRMAAAGGFLQSLPYGSYTQQDQSQHQEGQNTVTNPGNKTGGLFGGLGTGLAALWGGN